MKSITIHGLDEPLNTLIRERAKQQGLSLNITIKKLLADSLGLGQPNNADNHAEFADLCGIWTAKELGEFDSRTEELKQVDERDWQ